MRNILLGEEHPDTISAMGSLAATYGSLGKYADAEKLQIHVLDMRNNYLEKSTQIQYQPWVALQLHMTI